MVGIQGEGVHRVFEVLGLGVHQETVGIGRRGTPVPRRGCFDPLPQIFSPSECE